MSDAGTYPAARPVRQRAQAALLIAADPGVHALPGHPGPGGDLSHRPSGPTSRTARYRCSTTDTSTSANPGLPPPDARKRRDRKPNTGTRKPCGGTAMSSIYRDRTARRAGPR